MIQILLLSCADPPMELALIPEEGAVNVLHAFHSNDLNQWNHRGPLAYGVSSLGLDTVNEGLRLTLIQEVRPPTWYEMNFKSDIYGFIYDGKNLIPRSWSVDDEKAIAFIDPQFHDGEFWYISPPKGVFDPALSSEPIPIRASNTLNNVYSAPKLADPSPIVFKNERYIFATQNASIVQLSGDPPVVMDKHPGQNSLFNGTTVPFATSIDDTLYLLGQRNVNGRRLPVISSSKDAISWQPWKPIEPIPKELYACTSPVMGVDPVEGYILFCIDERPPPTGFKR